MNFTWLALPSLLLLGATGCPADADENGTDSAGSSETGDATTMSTTMSTTVSTTDSTTVSTTDSTTVSTTDTTTTVSTTDTTTTEDSSGTTDPDTSGSGSEESSSGSAEESSSGSEGTTGAAMCDPFGDACLDCVIVDNCCAEFTICTDDADCACMLGCLGEDGATLMGCLVQCQLRGAPEELDALFGCFEAAPCDNVCA